MISITDKKTNKYIEIINDDRYKLMLGYTSYFIANIKKYRDTIKQFENKEKVYKVLNPYNFQIINQTEEKVIDIQSAFEKKYGVKYDNQKYYQIFEVMKKFVNGSVFTEDEEVEEICKVMKLKFDNKKGKNNIVIDSDIEWDECRKKINENLAVGGNAIIRIRTILNNDILLFINSLCKSFKTVDIYRPKITNIWLGNKYLVCKGFNGNLKQDTMVDTGLLECLTENNNLMMTEQAVEINKVVDYINKRNYFSEQYMECFEKQKKAHEKWINEYL